MKKLIRIEKATTNTDLAILFVRIAAAGLLLTHGLPKLSALLSGNIQFPEIMGMSASMSLTLAVIAEVIAPLFILFGLGTRIAAIPVILTMLVAAFYVHAADPFGKKEMALLYSVPFIGLLFAGSGKFSIDSVLQKRSKTSTTAIDDPTLSIYHIN